jgi:hypothetical protein
VRQATGHRDSAAPSACGTGSRRSGQFKGSLSAAEVAAAVVRGLAAEVPDLDVTALPVADGGEGTLAAAVVAASDP